CFKAYPAFDADDGIANMDIPADAVRLCDSLQLLDDFHRANPVTIQCHRLTVFESQCDAARCRCRYRRRPRVFRSRFMGSECFSSAHWRTPYPFVDGIFGLFLIVFPAMFMEVFEFLFAAQLKVADRRDD